MSGINNQRMHLFMMINQVSFALNDITLYLDTHPKDANALEYYRHMQRLREKAKNEYESQFGPLTAYTERGDCYWRWSVSPWPWERGYY